MLFTLKYNWNHKLIDIGFMANIKFPFNKINIEQIWRLEKNQKQ